jgi:outer membrane protein OmpA-like peptidoglycan-associated protein
MLTLLLSLWLASAHAADLDFGYVQNPGPAEQPGLFVTPTRAVSELYVTIEVGGKTLEFTKKNVPAGVKQTFRWPRDTSVTHAEAYVRATYVDGDVVENAVPIDYSYAGPLKVNLAGASADLASKTITVTVTGPVRSADIVAFGAGKAELERTTVDVAGGPGKVQVPFVGDPSEVVLLDITLRNATSYAGFTYSPWFLDIPHEDVLFASNSAEIPADQAWKLEATLRQLQDVVEKYGSMVPVKLYIAGCTDTVGDAGSNAELSQRRARAIASWLRGHGYDKPIFTWGFGESLLAVQTGDNVDSAVNRRALYMVGANPPPAGSGVPAVGWRPL